MDKNSCTDSIKEIEDAWNAGQDNPDWVPFLISEVKRLQHEIDDQKVYLSYLQALVDGFFSKILV